MKRILVRRMGALGDVILATPIVRRLRRENPSAQIWMQTAYPNVFDGNVHLNPPPIESVDRYIDLDLAYERRPHMHTVCAYMQQAFGDDGDPADRQQELFYRLDIPFTVPRPFVVVHATGVSWRSKIRSPQWWRDVHTQLRQAGFTTVAIGTPGDFADGAQIDARQQNHLPTLAGLMHQAACFVGVDSGPLHIAGATDVPIVSLFTVCRPELRLPWRGGEVGRDCLALTPSLDCVGCLHEAPPPVTMLGCRRGDYACVADTSIPVERVVDAVKSIART
jgi:ADP-heptose:LPS heptosyltransferase